MENPSGDMTSRVLNFALFQGLEQNSPALHQLVKLMKYETFQVRDYIIDEKRDDQRMFFLLNGQVVINKMNEAGQIVVIGKADASSNPYFGESILLGKYRKSANVVAYTQCQCLSLSARDFQVFMESHPYVVASIYRTIASILWDKLNKANKDIFIQGLSSR